MDRLQAMRVFVAVAEAASFAGGARQLNLSPTQVTRAVAALEERLGVPLLRRTSRSVRLTDAGASYLEDCRHILARLEEAEQAVQGASAIPQGWLSVTAPVLFGQMHVMPVLLEYLQAHPLLRARTVFVDRVVSLLEEGLDVAVRIGELPDSSLIAVPAGRVRRVLCAAPAYLARRGRPAGPDELARHRLIVNSELGQWRFGSAAVRVDPALVVNGNPPAIAAAVAGFGIARVLSYQVAAAVAAGQLEIVLQDHEPPPWPVHVLHARGPAKVVAFVELLARRLRQVSGT